MFVLSSNYEGLPLVILEAMAAGLPIISTNVGGVKDIVTDNGILVEPNCQEALSKAIMSLADDVKLRLQMGRRSYDNVQQFDSKQIADGYIDLYQKYAI